MSYQTITNRLDFNETLANQKLVAGEMQNQISDIKGIVKDLPKSIPLRHTLDIKSKGIITAVVTVFILLALLSGFCFHLWSDNNGLHANDVKFRAIRQMSPEWTHWADTTYTRNPEAMERNTIKFENDALEKAEAELLAKQKDDEAKAAKKNLRNLRSKSDRRNKQIR